MTRTRIVPASRSREASWENQYFALLAQQGALSTPARAELAACARRVLNQVPSPRDATEGHRVIGAVVGAIQSGKTGLMAALAAGALDAGFQFVLVLSGLRDDLREQTALRFVRDLLQRGDRIYPDNGEARYTHPEGPGFHGECRCWAPHYRDDVNHDQAFIHTFAKRLGQGLPVVAVAKKNIATLNAIQDAISYVRSMGAHLPFLVLDDECDEASVSDAVEAPTPDRIGEIIAGPGGYAVYVGLTATPAANLLQDVDSPLYPKDFVEVLRVPGESTTSLSFLEPEPDRRYTGGDTFYRLLDRHGRPNFLVRAVMSDSEFAGLAGHSTELEEALIAYFVAGAIRILLQPGASFTDPERLPAPHTMLAHTEFRTESHWDLCSRVMSIVRLKGGRDSAIRENVRRLNPALRLSRSDLQRWLEGEPERWRCWYDQFVASRRMLLEVSPDRSREAIPPWDQVQSALLTVFEHTRLRVINSDDSSLDEPLSFEPSYAGGRPTLPRDIYSIVIGGNKLSRGLTVEGLCVSYYTRSSAQLTEDTTVQRERWFGYRGKYIEFCRVFTHRSLALSLSRFHEHDEDLRLQLAWNIRNGRQPADATYRFLTLRHSMPTAKRGRGQIGSIEVSGTRLFFDRVQMGDRAEERLAAEINQGAAADWCMRIDSGGRDAFDGSGNLIARVLEGVDALEIATLLDSFAFVFHNPLPFSGYQANLRDFYRQPNPRFSSTEAGLDPPGDQFLVAAYLRFWHQAFEICQQNPAENRFRAQDTVSPWRPCLPPLFNCAMRLGSLQPSAASPFRHRLLNRAISPDGRLGSRWGGRGYGSLGDEWIDLPPPNGDTAAPRADGTPGLLLLHVVSRDAKGRSGEGSDYAFDRPAIGMVIPEGGPCVSFVLAD